MRFNEFTSHTVTEGYLDNPGAQDSPVASAITRRILLQRTDLLGKYGPEKVGQAVDEVADFVGDVDEIGSSDVSGWIRHVEQMLGNMGEGVAKEVGQIDELSPATLTSYKNKARAQVQASPGATNYNAPTTPKIANRARGAVKADNRLHGFGPVKKSKQDVEEGGYPEVDHIPGKRGIGLDSAKPKDTYVATFHASKEKEAQEFAKKNGYIVKKHVYPKSANNSQPHEFQVHKNEQGVAENSDELYGLRVGDSVKAVVNGKRVQGDVIDIFPETMEVELLLRGANAGRTVTVDVRDTEALSEQGVAEVSKEKTQGIALSKAYKKDFDDKKPGQGRAETALTGTYSKTGKPGGELKKKGVAEGGFKNKTAVFSGYSNYMRSRAPNVFKQLDIKVLNKEYFEDEDIIEYTVISDGDSLAKARATLETNPQFGGMVLKKGVAEAGGRDSWDSNMPGYQGDYGGAENWGRRSREDDEHHEIDRQREQQLAQYNQTGKFWLKYKDSQKHVSAEHFIGKAAATAAAQQMIRAKPEVKGNLLITAHGPNGE